MPKPSNKKPRKAQVKDDSGNGSDADEQPAKIKHKDISSNESDADSDATKKKKMVNKSDSDSESQPKKKAKKKSAREKCMYGEKCYRSVALDNLQVVMKLLYHNHNTSSFVFRSV